MKLSLIALLAVGTAGCSHEARITGPTQCFAPHGFKFKVVRASAIVKGQGQLTASTAPTP